MEYLTVFGETHVGPRGGDAGGCKAVYDFPSHIKSFPPYRYIPPPLMGFPH